MRQPALEFGGDKERLPLPRATITRGRIKGLRRGIRGAQAIERLKETTSVDNKRKHPRREVSDIGKIMITQPFSVVDCVVRDISEGGACLEVSGTAQLLASFELVYAERRRRCRVAWQSGRRIGVAFV